MIKEGEEVLGSRVRVKVVKNKVAPPFRIAEFDILFNEGISTEGNLVDVGSELGVMKKSGSWYEYNGQKIAQGREEAKQYLRDNPKVASEIDAKIREMIKSGSVAEPLAVGAEEDEEVPEG